MILVLLLFTSCNNGNKVQTNESVIHVNRLERINNSDIPPNSFMKEIKYVNLYSADIELNFKEISKIKIHNNHFFIMDSYMTNLLVYDFSGNAITKIGNRGNGPNDYVNITDFDIDNEGNIYVIDGTLDKLFVYDRAFKFMLKKDLPFSVDIIKVLENGNFLLGLSSWDKSEYKGARVIRSNNQFEDVQILNYYDKYVDHTVWISNYTFSTCENGILYNKPLDNEILQFSKTGELTGSFFLDFGKEAIPNEVQKDIMKYFGNFET